MPAPSPLRCGVRVALLDADARLYSVEIYESGKDPHLVEIHDQDHAATLACEVIRRQNPAHNHPAYADVIQRMVSDAMAWMLVPEIGCAAAEWPPELNGATT